MRVMPVQKKTTTESSLLYCALLGFKKPLSGYIISSDLGDEISQQFPHGGGVHRVFLGQDLA